MKKALFGNGGHAHEVMSQIGKMEKFIKFVDDDFYDNKSCQDILPLSKFDPYEFQLMICMGESQTRKEIVNKLPKETRFFSFVHPTALILDDKIDIGEGSFIGAYSVLTTNIKIGKHAILNRSNHIGHDCEIQNFFSMMPGSIVSGNVKIGNNVYMGTNSSVKEKIEICDNVIIGMNAAVVKNIYESGVYMGVPAKNNKN